MRARAGAPSWQPGPWAEHRGLREGPVPEVGASCPPPPGKAHEGEPRGKWGADCGGREAVEEEMEMGVTGETGLKRPTTDPVLGGAHAPTHTPPHG